MLGDLLKNKSQEGVRVLLLVWDDPTSRSIMGYKTVSSRRLEYINMDGIMQTFDEETRRFFKHSSVQCYFALDQLERVAGSKSSIVFTTWFRHDSQDIWI